METRQQDSELAAALLQWVKSFDTIPKIQTWQDLEDGVALWKILHEIDPDYFNGALPEIDRKAKGTTADWIPRWQNLKHIERLVSSYIRDECGSLPYLSKSLNPDLKAVATEGSAHDTMLLTKAVLLAAMYSDKSEQRTLIVDKIGGKGASAIANAIQEMEELDERFGTSHSGMDSGPDVDTGDSNSEIDPPTDIEDDVSPPGGSVYERDPELEREEKLIAALQEKRKLEEKLQYLEEDLRESEDKRRAMEEELQESKFGHSHRRRTTMDEENLAALNVQADRDRDYIAKLETDLSDAQSKLENQHRQLERLKVDAQSKQDLRDELQVTRSERDELRQKSKANENLRKKIQSLQDQVSLQQNLQRELSSAQEALSETDRLRERCVQLERVNEENAKTIANGEQEIFDQKTAKEALKYELKVLGQRFEQTREMLSTAQESIREMEDRGAGAGGSDAGGGDRDSELDLDAELNAPPEKLEEARKAAAEKCRSLAKASVETADLTLLQQNLSISQQSIQRLEQRCLDLLQENLGLKTGAADGDSAFAHQVKRLESLETDNEDLEARYEKVAGEVVDLRRLLELSETSAFGERERSQDEVVAQNRERMRYMEELQQQLREHRSLLRHALLGTDALVKQPEELRRKEEFALVKQQLELVKEAPVEGVEKVVDDTAMSLTERIESARSLVSAHLATISTLETQLKDAKNANAKPLPAPPPKDSQMDSEAVKKMKQDYEIVVRENKLMASAWHDLTSRIQSNTVLLTRRRDDPKSFVGRARQGVAGPRVMGR